MTKDGPHSSRMRFGFREARDAGVPYFAGRSPSAINLGRLLEARPHLRHQASALVNEGWRTDAILNELRNSGRAERYCVDFYRGTDGDEWLANEWSDDQGALIARIERELKLRICSYAELWEFGVETGEWSIIAKFPEAI